MIKIITNIKVVIFDKLETLEPLTPWALGNFKNLIYDFDVR